MISIARKRRTAADAEPYRFATLAEAYLGLGDGKGALELAQRAADLVGERGHGGAAAFVQLRLANVLLAVSGMRETERINAVIGEGLAAARATSSRIYEAFVLEARAELARQTGNEEALQRDISEAHRLFVECGAHGHSGRLASDLTTAP